MLVQYFLRNAKIAEIDFPRRAQSLALFCSTCGDIWGRVFAADEWRVESVPCEKHRPTGVPDWGRWPGSFLNPLITCYHVGFDEWPTCVEYLPDTLVKREFDLYMSYLAKESQNEIEDSSTEAPSDH